MAKTKISEFSTTAGNNTDINSINLAEGCAPSGINDAIRELMRQLKEFQTGGAGDSVNSGGDFSVATNKFNVASATGVTSTAGNLGVGLTPSSWTSSYKAVEVGTAGSSIFSNGASSTVLSQGFINNSGNKYAQSSYAVGGYQINGGAHSWFYAASGTSGNAVSLSQVMTLHTSGGLSLGNTTDPGANNIGLAAGGKLQYSSTAYMTPEDNVSGARIVTGGIIRFDSGGTTERMRLDSSGNLGIGTSSPSTKLTVHAGADGDVGFFRGGSTRQVQIGTSSTAGYINTDNGSAGLELRTQGTARAYLDNSGNLGLGVTPSASSACVNMELSAYGATLSARNNASAPQFAMMSNAVGNWYAPTYKINGKATMYLSQGNDGSHSWHTAGTGTAGNAITFTQAMTLDASGNLGLGATTTTGGRLVITQNNATQPAIYLPTDESTIQGSDTNTQIRMGSNLVLQSGNVTNISAKNASGYITFGTGSTPTERARIDSSGNFNVGTAIADAGRLNINGVGGTSVPTSLYIETSASGTTDYALRIYNSGTTALFTIRTDGVVNTGAATNSPVNLTTANAANVYVGGASGTLYKSTSSRKYKRDIENTPRGLVDLLKLRAVIYKQKTADVDGNIPDTVHGGLIAEEVHDAGLTEFVQYADDGTPDALAYGHMVSLCVKAIQEQQVLIQQLTARVAQLESN